MSNQTIDGVLVPRDLALRILECISYEEADELRALLDAESAPCAKSQVEPAAQPQGEPVAFTAVGVLRDDGDGGLAPEWILEGGTSELWAGAMLLIADEDQELCAEDGHCELYRVPVEQPPPDIKLHCNVSHVKITVNEDGSYTIDPAEPVTQRTYPESPGRYYNGCPSSALSDPMQCWRDGYRCGYGNAEQPAPVAVVLPEREDGDDPYDQYKRAWNACLDEVTRLNAKPR